MQCLKKRQKYNQINFNYRQLIHPRPSFAWYTNHSALPVVLVDTSNPLEPSIYTRGLDHLAVVRFDPV